MVKELKGIDAKQVVYSAREVYNAMHRNGWYLPPLNCGLVTVKYMHNVRVGALYCPQYCDLRFRPCPDPPKKVSSSAHFYYLRHILHF
jgi:hypothetical protein